MNCLLEFLRINKFIYRCIVVSLLKKRCKTELLNVIFYRKELFEGFINIY